jgi:hypothetical protein
VYARVTFSKRINGCVKLESKYNRLEDGD